MNPEHLERLLTVQEEFGETLISPEELHLIYQHWNLDIQQERTLADG